MSRRFTEEEADKMFDISKLLDVWIEKGLVKEATGTETNENYTFTIKIEEASMMNNSIKEKLSALSNRELQALNESVSVLYFNDSSDYVNGLWGVVDALLGDSLDDDFEIGKLKTMIEEAL